MDTNFMIFLLLLLYFYSFSHSSYHPTLAEFMEDILQVSG